jgi:hypothetical protein
LKPNFAEKERLDEMSFPYNCALSGDREEQNEGPSGEVDVLPSCAHDFSDIFAA